MTPYEPVTVGDVERPRRAMKPLTGVTVSAAVVALMMPVAVSATVAVCVTNPHASVGRVGRADAVSDVRHDPDDGAILAAELDAISRAIGTPVPAYSILRDLDAYGTGWGGPSVNMLATDIKIAIARLEIAIGQRLDVVSGYRTAGYQAQLCQRVTGPCAPPGRSLHQLGLAVDVIDWPATLAHLLDGDQHGAALASLRGLVDLLDRIAGQVVVAQRPFHDALQDRERADDRGATGARMLQPGRPRSARRRWGKAA